MKTRRASKAHKTIALVCFCLAVVAGILEYQAFSAPLISSSGIVLRSAFLVGLPLMLGVVLLTKTRWVLMAVVMYGTIGLALDISTTVHHLTKEGGQSEIMVSSAITGTLNFLLIVLGGREFLNVPER